MSRIDITLSNALLAIRAKLMSDLAIDEVRMLSMVDPMSPPDITPTGDYFVSVALGDGEFPMDEQGSPQLNEDCSVIVTAYSKFALDNPGNEHEFLHHLTRGVLLLKKRMLASLAGADLTVVGGTDVFLRDLILVRRASPPDFDPKKLIGWQSITVSLNYDWDLSP